MPKTSSILEKQLTEKIAVSDISSFLLSHGIIIAQPAVDLNGADLLALMEVKDGAKFARIQCKGRTLADPKSENTVSIKKSYVTGTFTLLLNVYYAYNSTEHLFCFFAYDIKGRPDLWKITDSEYRLTLSGKSFEEKLDLFRFTESRVKALKEIIRDSNVGKEFHYVFGKGKSAMPVIKAAGHASSP